MSSPQAHLTLPLPLHSSTLSKLAKELMTPPCQEDLLTYSHPLSQSTSLTVMICPTYRVQDMEEYSIFMKQPIFQTSLLIPLPSPTSSPSMKAHSLMCRLQVRQQQQTLQSMILPSHAQAPTSGHRATTYMGIKFSQTWKTRSITSEGCSTSKNAQMGKWLQPTMYIPDVM